MIYVLVYLGAALTILAVLCGMILRIGHLMDHCPSGGGATRTAALTIATGFAAIGTGGVILGCALLVALNDASGTALSGALGLVVLCLGLGFSHAVATLRTVLVPMPADAPGDTSAPPAQ
ncbi:MAG: hypothetical protein OIF47_14245 [Marinibacterium sp.]|nr:hypothetical protein [Marinibacterium sp.]